MDLPDLYFQVSQACSGMDEEKRRKMSCGAFPPVPYKWEEEDPALMGNETISM